MYINSRVGLVILNPASIQDDPVPPQTVLSNLSLVNRPGDNLNYEGSIPETKEITKNKTFRSFPFAIFP